MDEDVRQLLQERRYPQAIEQLLDRYESKVFRLALMFLRNPARAEEVTQDVFLKLWKALPAYDGRAAPGLERYNQDPQSYAGMSLSLTNSNKAFPLPTQMLPHNQW